MEIDNPVKEELDDGGAKEVAKELGDDEIEVEDDEGNVTVMKARALPEAKVSKSVLADDGWGKNARRYEQRMRRVIYNAVSYQRVSNRGP